MNETLSNKRIAKNTLLLYGRMLFTMAITLFTSRIVLKILGVVDYGIYNVVGGVVTMFTFLNSAMITSTQRYITFELSKGNIEHLKVVFTTSIQIHLLISFLIIILGETVGLWFLYEKMVIPEERFRAAMWVYQLSILTMSTRVMSVPYNSDIIAHEHMGVFAAISVIEVILKLAVVYILVIGNLDKLILYAILIATIQILIRYTYTQYCHHHYKESHLVKVFNKCLFKEMIQFMGWNIWGNLAGTLFRTGLNLLLNIFFGPIVNAARAVAVQVEGAITQFSGNFLMAVNPQIIKLYSQNNLREMHRLIYRSCKFTFFLLLALSLPIIIKTDSILSIWLTIVPDYTSAFIRILLCITIINAVARPLMTAAAATGDVKLYQSLIGGILLTIVPIAYIVLKLGGTPESVYIVQLAICLIAFIVRLYIIRSMICLSVREYILKVLFPCISVLIPSTLMSLGLLSVLPGNDITSTITACLVSVLTVVFSTFLLGLEKGERTLVCTKLREVYTQIRVFR